MKNAIKYLTSAVMMTTLMALLAWPQLARGQESFNVTNMCLSTDSIVSWPTNSVWTNGMGWLTGKYIYVGNQDQVGLYVSSQSITNATNNAWLITFIRSWSDSPPQIQYLTNNSYTTNIYWKNDFEETSLFTVTTVSNNLLSRTSGLATNVPVTYYTNLNQTLLGQCKWLGIWAITNTSVFPNMFTNIDVGLSKKIIPVRWP